MLNHSMIRILQNNKLASIAFWVWAITIFILSVIPNTPAMKMELNNKELRLDYLIHFAVYFTLGILFFLWLMNRNSPLSKKQIVFLIILGVIFAGFSEVIQHVVPGRTFNIMDFYSNNLGLFSGVIIPTSIFRKKTSNRPVSKGKTCGFT